MHRHFPKEEMLLFNKHGKCLNITANQSQANRNRSLSAFSLLVFKMIMGTAPARPRGASLHCRSEYKGAQHFNPVIGKCLLNAFDPVITYQEGVA